jgi:hypothetical protein
VRSQHWIDTAAPSSLRRRIYRPWMSYRLPGRDWQAADDADPAPASGVPDDWSGTFDFAYTRLGAALQFFGGDTTDPDNTTLVGVRSSAQPDLWVNFKALDVVPGVPWGTARRALTWPGAWPNCDLAWLSGCGRLAKRIRIVQPPHQASFAFAMRLAPGMTHAIAGDRLAIYDGDGARVFVSRPPFVEDAVGAIYPAHLSEDAPTSAGYPVVVVSVDPAELAGATYPAVVDPDITFSGTADTEDAGLGFGFSADQNFGGAASYTLEEVGRREIVARIVGSALPAGTPTACTYYASRINTAPLSTTCSLRYFPGDWIEGTSIGANEPGACNRNYAVDDTAAWGAPLVTDDSQSLVYPGGTPNYAPLSVDLGEVAAWMSGARPSNGFWYAATTTTWPQAQYTSEALGSLPYWDLTYSPPSGRHRGFGRGFDRGFGRGLA